jgi:hypothetical protein
MDRGGDVPSMARAAIVRRESLYENDRFVGFK